MNQMIEDIQEEVPQRLEIVFSPDNFRDLKQKIVVSDSSSPLEIGAEEASVLNAIEEVRHFLPREEFGGCGKYDWIWHSSFPKDIPFGILPSRIKVLLNARLNVVDKLKRRVSEQRDDLKTLVGFVEFLAAENQKADLSFKTRIAEYEAKISALNGLELENKRMLQRRESLEDAKRIIEEHKRILGSLSGLGDPLMFGRVRPLTPLPEVPLPRGPGRPPGKGKAELPPLQDDLDDQS